MVNPGNLEIIAFAAESRLFLKMNRYNSGLPLVIHFKIPGLFPDFSLTFYSFPYSLLKNHFYSLL